MKLKEEYNKYKKNNKEYVLIIKCGSFYEILNDDAYVINNIFGYKIKKYNNFIKVGFPLNTLTKVTTKLDSLKINYLVIDKDITVIKAKFNKNQYSKFI